MGAGRANDNVGSVTAKQPAPFELPEDTPVFDLFLQHVIQGYREEIALDPFDEAVRRRLESADDPLCVLDFDGVVTFANGALCSLLSCSTDDLVRIQFATLVAPEYQAAVHARLNELSQHDRKGQAASTNDILLFRTETKSGKRFSIECVVLGWRTGQRCGIIAVMRDLNIHYSMLEEFRRARLDYDTLSETITDAVLRITEDFRIVYANSAVKQTFGYGPGEVIHQPFEMLFPDGEFERYRETFRKYFFIDDTDRERFGLDRTIELLGKHRNRGVSPMELSLGNSKQDSNRTLTCIVRDITHRKTMERKLRRLAYYDKLTNVGNRDLFNLDVQGLLKSVRERPEVKSAVLFLDIDGFNQVNDTLGHGAGDRLLIETARRLRRSLRDEDGVYRFGGDEFVILLRRITREEDAAVVANKVLSTIRMPYEISTVPGKTSRASVGVSIGIACIPRHGTSLDEIVRTADIAMYEAKNRGKNRFAVFSREIDSRNALRWEIRQGIQRGLEENHFYLCYQPVVDRDGYVKGIEGLLRWADPSKGTIYPDTFIPIAEESGLMVTLGNWVIRRACREFKALLDRMPNDFYLAVNLSPKQLEDSSFVESIEQAVRGSGVMPERIQLEITETSLMSAPQKAVQRIKELKSRLPGLKISIDDFGTGFSSLSYLSQLPVDTLKIDRTFVAELDNHDNDTSEKITNAIINLAHSLDLNVVAEGVESEGQWSYLREHGCDTLQGYLFSPAVSFKDLPELLERLSVRREHAAGDLTRPKLRTAAN